MSLAGLGRINMLGQMPATGDIPNTKETEPVRNVPDGREEFWLAWNAIKKDLSAWDANRRHTPDIPVLATAPSSPGRKSESGLRALSGGN
jgi:hypothetical protein